MNRAILLFFLGIVTVFLGASVGLGQTAPSPRPGAPMTPRPALNNANAQKAPEPEKTQIIAIYRGSGFFDEALAQKVRPALVKAFHLGSEAETGSTARRAETPPSNH
jgi:hypothetical protein